MRVSGLPPVRAHQAIDAAFGEVAAVQRLMSFHDPDSDVSRINRAGAHRPVVVHQDTFHVLRVALDLAARSQGAFDITVGTELVAWGLLPAPLGARTCPDGTWRDIELTADRRLLCHRPLWIDLGGIAKGYAVDRATDRLRACGATQTVVNAGGDLRVQGPDTERIYLQLGSSPSALVPVLELASGSIASSSGHRRRRWQDGRLCGPHVDGVRRSPLSTTRFVCVAADACILADALTKVVMAQGAQSADLLEQCGASAHLHDVGTGWLHVGAAA